MFEIGDKVTCINATGGETFPILEYGKEYTVLNIRYCRNCNKQSIDVGTTYETNPSINTVCSKCGTLNLKTINTPCCSLRFKKVIKTPAELIESALLGGYYDVATKLIEKYGF